MQSRPSPRACLALLTGFVLGAVVTACAESDPLEPVRQLHAEGRISETLEPLRELIEEAPTDWEDAAEAHYLYARALVERNRPQLALWSLQRAMEDPEWEVDAGFALGKLAISTGDHHQAVQAADRILEREPDNVEALLMRANAYALWRVDPNQAVADARRAAELDPEILAPFEPLILALLALEDEPAAKEALAQLGERIAQTDPPADTRAWYCATIASFEKESQRPEEARAKWNECLEDHASDPTVVSMAVKFFDEQRNPDRALEILRKAHAERPDFRQFRVALAQRLDRTGESDAAAALLEGAIEGAPPQNAAVAWMDLSAFRYHKGDFEGSVDALREAWDLARREGEPSPQLTFQYADRLVVAGHYDRALELARGMSADAYRHLIRARVAQQRGEIATALAEFEAGNRLWPDNATARYYTARAAEVAGDFERALEEYRASIRIESGATDARVRAAQLLAANGRTEEANQVLFTRVNSSPLDLDGDLFALRLGGLRGDGPFVARYLQHSVARQPQQSGRLLAAAADGVAERAGPEAALRLFDAIDGFEPDAPGAAPALRSLVRLAHAAGEPERAADPLRRALEADPELAALHEIRGLQLELTGAPADEARAAYQRSLELAPDHSAAWTGLGRVAASTTAAVEAFDRAAKLDAEDPEPRLLAAKSLADAGEVDAASERLEALLRSHPTNAEAARLRASLDLQRGISSEQTLARARNAVWLGGGAPALELLAAVHAARDEPELATRASERARALREERPSQG